MNYVKSQILLSTTQRGFYIPHRAVSLSAISLIQISALPSMPLVFKDFFVQGILNVSVVIKDLQYIFKQIYLLKRLHSRNYQKQKIDLLNNRIKKLQCKIMKTRITILLILLAVQSFTQDEETEDTTTSQQEQFTEFSQHLGDFVPSESFQFNLNPGQQQTFIFWPPPDLKVLRGMFYITSQQNKGLFVGVQHDGIIQKSFWDKRIGIFSVSYSGVGDMKLIVKSQLKKLLIYFSYEFLSKKKQTLMQQSLNSTENSNSTDTSQLKDIVDKFSKVKNSLSGQQQVLKSIIRSTILQGQRIRNEINSKTYRVIIQTIVLVVSGIVSIVMLRDQFKKGYELIV